MLSLKFKSNWSQISHPWPWVWCLLHQGLVWKTHMRNLWCARGDCLGPCVAQIRAPHPSPPFSENPLPGATSSLSTPPPPRNSIFLEWKGSPKTVTWTCAASPSQPHRALSDVKAWLSTPGVCPVPAEGPRQPWRTRPQARPLPLSPSVLGSRVPSSLVLGFCASDQSQPHSHPLVFWVY